MKTEEDTKRDSKSADTNFQRWTLILKISEGGEIEKKRLSQALQRPKVRGALWVNDNNNKRSTESFNIQSSRDCLWGRAQGKGCGSQEKPRLDWETILERVRVGLG